MVSDSTGRDTIKRVYWRLMPFLILCYIVAFLDRVNVGFAALHMNADLGFTAYVYGFGAGIFSIGYFVFEVPSNLALHKVGARIWIPRIMITWGLISAGFAFVYNENSFYVMRFLLGAAEAGFFPGIVFYLSKWFPSRMLGSATAVFILGLPVSVLIGAPVSTALLETMGGVAGLRNWQWMFLVEGGLAVVVGIIAYGVLTRGPEEARWLTDEQRDWLVRTLAAERAAKEQVKSYGVLETLMSGKVLLLAFAIFCNIGALFGVTLWMPQIIKGFGGLSNTQAGLLTAVPYFCAGAAMVLNGWHSDRTEERRFHILIPACIGGLGLAMAGFSQSPLAGMIAICVGASGILASNILFWPLPSLFLTGAAAAAGIALVNSVGNLGGFVGPYINGWAKDYFGDYSASMCVLGGMVALYGVVIFAFLSSRARPLAQAAPPFAPHYQTKAE
ncbi:MFS transporter [Phreatobacter sp. AB_2022a]|uniref:MFS transporter n=1 Tax=Phreatobacter sp. AB_2022a TaxID=3003134 RepID=UPI000579AB2B|nr:MFS transporter [Phreatobacter sp. AB_2022a]MCZ0736837.1 MFS transporter [Phreatobacter sp. AB_2022a]CEJ15187.1 Putative tartrate transporter [bacterium YEK0313]